MQADSGYRDLMNETIIDADQIDTDYITVNQGVIIKGNSNQLVFGDPFTTTINVDEPTANRIYSIRDVGTDADFVMTEGNQTINGIKTFAGTIKMSSLTASQAVVTDASKNLTSYPYTAAPATPDTIVSRDINGDTVLNHLYLNGSSNQMTIQSNGGGSALVNFAGSSIARKYTFQDPFSDCTVLNDKGSFTIGNNWTVNQDWTFNATINSRDIIPNTTTTYTLGNSSNRYSTADIATVYADQLDSRSSTLSSNKTLKPSVNNGSDLGNSSFAWGNADIATLWAPNIKTRSGGLLLNPNNNTVQIPATIWENFGDAGGGTTTGFPTNQFICSNSDGHYAMYWGVYHGTLQRGVMQMYDAVGATGLPLVCQPNAGSTSRFIIGDYDITAQSNTDKVYINGRLTKNGVETNTILTDSTSVSTGSAVFQGGVGIQKAVYCGSLNTTTSITSGSTINSTGPINANDTTNATSTTTGSVIVDGGIGCAKDIYCDNLRATNTTDSSSTSTGTIVSSGGLGIAKKVYIGTGIYFPNQSQDTTELNWYSAKTYTDTFTGPFITPPTVDVWVTRIGREVHVEVSGFSSATGTNSGMTFSTTLPASYRPVADVQLLCAVISNSATVQGNIVIRTTGVINVYTGLTAAGNFGNLGNGGILFNNTVSYRV